ncbi:MAG: N-acetylmuramoyl-L-alanine amidase [Candidatus Pelagibacter bacterium]|nr:N-acetylmuramoyl-L-alanine amidase [Candidatus Pelagibacter bacterium]
MKIKSNFSPNHSIKQRSNRDIKFVIIHYTGMQSEIESVNRLKDPKYKLSCHYLINRRGEIIRMVRDRNVAWHAGKSKWKKFINLNNSSIGIELVNKGHRHGYQNFNKKQIINLINLCKNLKQKYLIKKENFLGHSDIAPLRKSDPGEKFPWKKLSNYNLGKWYIKDVKNFRVKTKNIRDEFFKNLHKLGYRYFSIKKKNLRDKKIIKCFQQHYLPNNVTGKIDEKTFKISHFLAH